MKTDTQNGLMLKLCCSLLILLWVYTAFSKLSEFDDFKRQLNNQVFAKDWTPVLAYLLPAVELITALLLLFKRTQQMGLWLSAILMAAFTAYISLVLMGIFERTPCSCGGVLKKLGWKAHLYFNLFFLLTGIMGIRLHAKERRIAVTG